MICEFHVLEPPNKEINAKTIFAVKRHFKQLRLQSLRKFRLAGIGTLTSAISVQLSNQSGASKPTGSLSFNWFVIKPGKGEDGMINIWIPYIGTVVWINKCKEDHHSHGCHLCSSNTWNLYTRHFLFIFPVYLTNKFNDQLLAGFLAQLVRALHSNFQGVIITPLVGLI